MEYEDDLVWIMAVYYNLMRAICMIYYWDNESEYMNMMDHLMSCFWEDLREFVEKKRGRLKTKKIISEVLALRT